MLRVFLPGAWRENDRLRRIAAAILVDAALDAGVKHLLQESFAPVYPDGGDDWISPHVARFARWVRDAGFTVYMPSLFGRDGAVPTADEGAAVFRRACMAAEFNAFKRDVSAFPVGTLPPGGVATAAARCLA